MKKNYIENIESKINFEIPKDVKQFFTQYKFNDLGLRLCDEETILNFENILINQDIRIEEKLFPILDNDNSDFAAIYLEGELKGMVCIIEHDEPDTSPKFLSLWTLYDSIKRALEVTKEEFIDFYEIENELPLFGSSLSDKTIIEIKNKLFSQYMSNMNLDKEREIAFRILKLVDEVDYNFIRKNLLKNADMFVQEETINTLKRKIKENYLNDIFEILEKENTNPLLATAVMLRENESLNNSYWKKLFKSRFPEIAKSYL